jgi:hypothetical protein
VYTSRATALAISFLAFSDLASAASPGRCETLTPPAAVSEQQALRGAVRPAGPAASASDAESLYPGTAESDRQALDEMLRGGNETRLRWDRVPALVVLMPVMQYEKDRGTQYRATGQQLTDAEASELVADLTNALAELTNNTFRAFASIQRETAAAGDVVNVMRPGQIVVARYNGVHDQLATIGFGGRSTRGAVIRAGSIILDSDFDRIAVTRRLLRTHELGHALGYNHVGSRPSIMNPKIGSELTDFDRAAVRIAYDDGQTAACNVS